MSSGFEGESVTVLGGGVLLVGVSLTIHVFFMFLNLKSQAWLKDGPLANAHGIAFLMPSVLVATLFIAVSSLIQIVLWAWVLWSCGPFDRFLDAMYVSSTTYTTLGTAPHVLVPPYRALEPMEAATGMLASGLNTAILFAVVASFARKQAGVGEFFR